MAQAGFTPIQLYFSTTAAAVPTSGNLANGELAINITDGKLYYKNNSGTVTLLAGAGGAINPITNNGVVYINSSGQAVSGTALTFDGTSLTFGSTSQRIIADMSSATIANRLAFQTSTTNSSTVVGAIPNGTSNVASFLVYNNSDPTNSSNGGILSTSTEIRLQSGISGTGTYLPLTFYTGGSLRATINTSGNLGVGTSSPAGLLDVSGTTPALTASQSSITVTAGTLMGAFNAYSRDASTTSTGGVGGIRVYAPADYNTSDTPSYMSFFTHDTTPNDGTLLGNPTERMRIDKDGNLGLGVTPSAWGSLDKAIDIGGGNQSTVSANLAGAFATNAFFDGTNWKYKNSSGNPSLYSQSFAGQHQWFTAPSGTAGNTITFTQAMTLNASGNLGVGETSPTSRLHVSFTSNSVDNVLQIQQKGNNTASGLTLAANDNNGAGYNFIRSLTTGGTTHWQISGGVATSTMAFSTGGTERYRIDSGGRIGFGSTGTTADRLIDGAFSGATTSGANQFGLVLNPTFPTTVTSALFNMYTGPNLTPGTTVTSVYSHYLEAINTTGSTVTNRWGIYQVGSSDNNYFAGNVGINTTSPGQKLDVNGNIRSRDGAIVLSIGTAQKGIFCTYNQILGSGTDYTPTIFSETGLGITFAVNGSATKAMSLDSSGNLLVGTTSVAGVARITVNGGSIISTSPTSSVSGTYSFSDNGASPNNFRVYNNTDSNNTGNRFIICDAAASVLRAEIRTNGGLANYQANNVNLSDRREKTNFAPAKSYLNVICAIPVQTFNYIDQNMEEDGGLTLGVVAQDVQAVAPELVMESNWAGRDSEPKMRLSIYQTDLQYALMKCIQEQQAIIESLKARLDAANL
jgi:hypothetical protein